MSAACFIERIVGTNIGDVFPGCRRIPTRSAELIDASFRSLYDYDTFMYDAFLGPQGDRVIMIGPPLLNLRDRIEDCSFKIGGRTVPDSEIRVIPQNRNCRLELEVPHGAARDLAIAGGEGEKSVRLSESGTDRFAGKRVLLTKSRDNELAWIRDWVRFHVRWHGIDAVLFYDNESQAYGLEDITETISEVPGIAAVGIVDWPFKFGPQGVGTEHWDSDYCQYGILEHARWRYLADASGVLCCDIDELVYCDGGVSVFDIVERHGVGGVSFEGLWVPNIPAHRQRSGAVPRFTDFGSIVKEEVRLSEPKWCVVPRLVSPDAQWMIHGVDGMRLPRVSLSEVLFWHFSAINTSWRFDRFIAEEFLPDIHKSSPLMKDVLAKTLTT